MNVTTRSAYNALKVFIFDPKILRWLKANDPEVLEQAIRAVELIEEKEGEDKEKRTFFSNAEKRRWEQAHKDG